MRSGLLRQPITIEQKTANGYSDTGQALYSWSTFASPRARLISKGAREFERIDQTRAEVTDVFVIRHRAGINSTMRVVYESNNYDVTGYQEQHGRAREGWIFTKRES